MTQWSSSHSVNPPVEDIASPSYLEGKESPNTHDGHKCYKSPVTSSLDKSGHHGPTDTLDMRCDENRPVHGLDLQSELSHPTVKIGKKHSVLPLLGAQIGAVNCRSASPESRSPPTPIEFGHFDEEVALETEMILMDQCESVDIHIVKAQPSCAVDVQMSFRPREKESELERVGTDSQGTFS
jgi:hypothetical protein